jgi:hypothetical protein
MDMPRRLGAIDPEGGEVHYPDGYGNPCSQEPIEKLKDGAIRGRNLTCPEEEPARPGRSNLGRHLADFMATTGDV